MDILDVISISYPVANVAIITASTKNLSLDYIPGQYALIKISETLVLPYSVAGFTSSSITFHLKIGAKASASFTLLQAITATQKLAITAILGNTIVANIGLEDVVLVAGGTGISQVCMLAEHYSDFGIFPNIYWGLNSLDALYLPKLSQELTNKLKIYYSDSKVKSDFKYPYQGIKADFGSMALNVIASGPVAMLNNLKDYKTKQNLAWNVISDI